MTETKIAESKYNKLQFTNPYYHIYTSNCNKIIAKKQESSMGTAIAISRPLQLYIHNIQTEPGTAILIDLFFPQNQRLRIISVYLPSNNTSLNLKLNKRLLIGSIMQLHTTSRLSFWEILTQMQTNITNLPCNYLTQ